MRLIALLMAAALVLSAASALAQVQNPEGQVTVVVQERTTMIFNEWELKGEIPKPSAQYWVGKRQAKFESQVRVRQNFLPEVMGSADAL